jgi:hypothetical protein
MRYFACSILLIITAIVFFPYSNYAQDASTIWIKAYGIYPAQTTVKFGNRIGNTWGFDSALSIPPEYREVEPPPANSPDSPPGFEVIWGQTRFGQWGNIHALLDHDYRDYSSPVQKDTFKLLFAQYDDASATISFRWPDASYLAAHCDSLFFRYTDSSGIPIIINMFTQDSIAFPMAAPRSIFNMLIFKSGVRLVETGVVGSTESAPEAFSLAQNYPNPFNPETKIQYSVASSQYIRIKIFDVLGREVATLVNEMKPPGEYAVSWDASNAPSGLYFYRIQAGGFTDIKKMIVTK